MSSSKSSLVIAEEGGGEQVCSACGSALRPEHLFCSQCGGIVGGEDPSPDHDNSDPGETEPFTANLPTLKPEEPADESLLFSNGESEPEPSPPSDTAPPRRWLKVAGVTLGGVLFVAVALLAVLSTLRIHHLDSEVAALQQQANGAQAQIHSEQAGLASMQAGLADLNQGAITSLGADLKSMNTTIDKLKSDSGFHGTEIAALQTHLGSEGTQISHLKTHLASFRGDITDLGAGAQQNQSDLSVIQQCIPEIENQLGSLSGYSYFDGTVSVYPNSQVSRYCSALVYGSTSGLGD